MADEHVTTEATDLGAIPSGESQSEGIQQIPAQINLNEVPAAADTRDILLKAIGSEAQHVADKFPGQAAAALEQLAHAYALVTGPTPVATAPAVITQRDLGKAGYDAGRQGYNAYQ
ncbi:hypothetical protein ACFUGD_03620 [Streptomyces sp. NPDC057217]|uniref:hypothetical protein n=1 Tax=Streptomyces sp. NPDC057217 TaxID=3346054 RepID=UPI0036408EC0